MPRTDARITTCVPASDLVPGDRTVGPGVFVDRGVIARTAVLPDGTIRVHYVGCTHVDRDPDYLFDVAGLVLRRSEVPS